MLGRRHTLAEMIFALDAFVVKSDVGSNRELETKDPAWNDLCRYRNLADGDDYCTLQVHCVWQSSGGRDYAAKTSSFALASSGNMETPLEKFCRLCPRIGASLNFTHETFVFSTTLVIYPTHR